MQPSGHLTIGNYLGALKQWVQVQSDYESFFCIVDMHAITMPHDPKGLRQGTREVAALYIACGLDPEKVTLFVQSHVPAHAELGWILNCVTPMGWLNRMTQFKDKTAKLNDDSIGTGIYTYPVLMAADILLYQTDKVPVGDDQKQHIELTRDLAIRFNNLFGETFTVPDAMIPPTGARIMGLDTPTAKMSKSEGAEGHAVYLLDPLDKARKKIMRAQTDSGTAIIFSKDPEKAGVNNLLTIYQAFTGEASDAIEARFAGKGYGDLKKSVAEVVTEGLKPIQERYQQITTDPEYLDNILAKGAEYAAAIAAKTLKQAREHVGFLSARG
jgi:tryptophanyl-tRNA synthetase